MITPFHSHVRTRFRACGGVAAALLLATLLPPALAAASQPPTPRPAVGLPGEETPVPAPGNQNEPAIARGGDVYLVAWTDSRGSFFDPEEEAGSSQDVFAARLDAAGNLVDTIPIAIAAGAADQSDPTVVWNGENWLVVYEGFEPHGLYYTRNIRAVRVSPAGEVLDAQPIEVWDTANSSEHLLGAASNGQDWALVIVDEYVQGLGTRFRLIGRRVTADGDLLEAPSSLFSPSCCYFFWEGGIAWSGSNYLVVFEGYVSGTEYGIFGLRLNSSLSTLDSYPYPITQVYMQNETQYYTNAEVLAGDDGFFVAWQFRHIAGSSEIYGARVNAVGESLDGDGFEITSGLVDFDQAPQIAWDGNQWIIGWRDGPLNLVTVSAIGGIGDIEVPLPNVGEAAFVGVPGGGAQLVWPEARVAGPLPEDLFTARLAADLTPGADQPVALGAPHQTRPDVAASGDGYLIVYRSDISGLTRIMARAVDASGNALADEPVELASGAVDLPRVAFDGQRYLAVWSEGEVNEIRGRRLTVDGTPLDGAALSLLDGREGDVAAQDGLFLVTALQGAGAAARVLGVRVDGDGNVLDVPALELSVGASVAPRAGQLGDRWLVVWEQTDRPDGSEIYSNRVETDGSVFFPLPLTGESDGLSHHRPAVAGAETTLVVWEDPRAGDGSDLYGRRATADLGFVDPAAGSPLIEAAANQDAAAVAWDGEHFLFAFEDDRSAEHAFDARTDIYRGWAETFGVVTEPTGLPLFDAATPEIDPAVAGAGGHALYVASVFDMGNPFAAYRLRLRPARAPTAVGEGDLPRAARLLTTYPNPANPAVRIRLAVPRPGPVAVDILDIRGRRVRTLRRTFDQAGEHELHWNGEDAAGRPLPSGTYLLRMRADAATSTGKLMLVR
jgi:hypothetical protein